MDADLVGPGFDLPARVAAVHHAGLQPAGLEDEVGALRVQPAQADPGAGLHLHRGALGEGQRQAAIGRCGDEGAARERAPLHGRGERSLSW
ncbi:MAG: hypothetical protein QM765_30845 [Myxococcales bacterium]